MSDQSFSAKLDSMKDYKVLTVADLVSILAGQPPMMEVFISDEDADETALVVNPRFINGIETVDGRLYLFSSILPKIVKQQFPKTHEEQLTEKRNMALNMQRNSDRATEIPEMVE